jgi:hypothetical protein
VDALGNWCGSYRVALLSLALGSNDVHYKSEQWKRKNPALRLGVTAILVGRFKERCINTGKFKSPVLFVGATNYQTRTDIPLRR